METIYLSVFAALFATLMSTSLAQVVIGRGNCPDIESQRLFDLDRFMGTWYEYERFKNWFEIGLVCGSTTYTSNADQSINVDNSALREIKIFGRTVVRRRTTTNGTATIVNPIKPAELKVAFANFDLGGGNNANYKVLDTDYNSYAVVFSCSKLPSIPLNIQFAWILTRARGVEPTNLASIKTDLQAAGIRVSNFKLTDQSNCESGLRRLRKILSRTRSRIQ